MMQKIKFVQKNKNAADKSNFRSIQEVQTFQKYGNIEKMPKKWVWWSRFQPRYLRKHE